MACVLEAPLRMSVLSEVTASSRHYVDRLFDLDPQKVLQGVIDMKNAVIGNNKQKANLIVLGAVPRPIGNGLKDKHLPGQNKKKS